MFKLTGCDRLFREDTHYVPHIKKRGDVLLCRVPMLSTEFSPFTSFDDVGFRSSTQPTRPRVLKTRSRS
ncbi:hypothetical protein [Nostoc sp. MG11]|uniref:hypothetical protein n=1 Tax=Nostoc sp. MG11 TaxID=2721166 RepID=UPI00186887DB|nr:hypothetical protein [Nostoc sp. MG11]